MSTCANRGDGGIGTCKGGLRRRSRSLLAGVSLLALGLSTPAAAGDWREGLRDAGPGAALSFDLGALQVAQASRSEARRFDIPAGGLQSALLALSQESDIQLLYPAELTAGLTTQGVQGEYTPEEALRRLLAGTGLNYRFTSADTVTLAPAEAPGGEGPMQLERIQVPGILVGTRVGERVEDSSASVEFFSAEDLEERPGTLELRDLYGRTTNIVDFGESNLAPAVRGVDGTGAASGGLGFIAGTRPRTTLTVDGRPLTTFEFVGGPPGLWDVEQVEIYRGPQTTLQGRNSIAGAIVLETKDPTFFWEGALQGAIGTEDRNRQAMMISGPLLDALAFRLAVDRFDGESFVDFLGPQAVDDVEDDERLTARAKLLLAPETVPEFTAQLTVAHTHTRRPQAALVDPPFDERARLISQTAFESESTDVILDASYEFSDRLTLSNSATFSIIEFERFDAPSNGQFRLEGPQLTNETLLNFNDPERGLQGVLGFFVFHEDRDDAGFIGTPRVFTFEDTTLTTSVFGEVRWEVVPRLHLTLGARYEREARERFGSAFGIDQDLDEVFDAFLPKFGAAYEVTDELTIGAVVSRGFNAGGGAVSFGASDADGLPSPDPALGPRSFVFDSEFVTNFELYARGSALDERLTFSGNLFYSDYEQQQRVEQIDFPGGFTDTIVVNTSDSRAYGAELGMSYAPLDEMELFADIGLLETNIRDARDLDLEGNDFARAPHLTANFGAAFRPTPEWLIGIDASYVGSYFSTDANNPLAEVDNHFIANFEISWQPVEHLRLFGVATNIFDSDAETRLFSFPESAPPSLAQLVDPRVFWIGAELRF